MSSAFPCGMPSTTSNSTMSPSSLSPASRAIVPPTCPPPTSAILLRAMRMPRFGGAPIPGRRTGRLLARFRGVGKAAADYLRPLWPRQPSARPFRPSAADPPAGAERGLGRRAILARECLRVRGRPVAIRSALPLMLWNEGVQCRAVRLPAATQRVSWVRKSACLGVDCGLSRTSCALSRRFAHNMRIYGVVIPPIFGSLGADWGL